MTGAASPLLHDAPGGDDGGGARPRATTAWLLGLVAGALGGLVTLSMGIGLPFLGPVALVVGALAPPRPFGLSGTLIGWGTLWTALFLRADAACDPASCRGPDLAPWLVASLAIAAIGCLLGIAATRRRRTSGRRR